MTASRPQPSAAPELPVLPSTDADFALLVTADGGLLSASSTVWDRLGWDRAQCARHGVWAAVVDGGQRAAVRHLLAETITTGSARTTLWLPSARGPLWVDAAAKLVDGAAKPVDGAAKLADGAAPRAVLVTARDVTHDLAAESQISASEHQWRMAFEHSPIGGVLLDAEGGVLVVNGAMCRMTGWREHELTRMDVTQVVVCEGGRPWQEWWSDLAHGGPGFTADVDRTVRTADGHTFWGRLSAATLAASTSSARVVMQVEDITSRREAELELAERALNDGLTGAPNRFFTRQWLASALEDHHPGAGVGVLYCDLDRFKVVNDSLGHAAGDDLLVQVTERLRGPMRPEDLLGRVGGDEFVVVVEGIRTASELSDVAERLAAAMVEPFDVGGHRHAMTLSLGGTIGTHTDSADEVMMRADMALLRAKRLGRSRYVAFDPTHDRIATKADLQLEDDLRVSLAARQLRAYYQPIVALQDSAVVGYEALVRWAHPEHGLLAPARFLALAESSGLIRPLGWWMLEQACRDSANGTDGIAPGSWVAVNASAGQLTRPGVASAVQRALQVSGLPASRLHLEITETALITATESLTRELHELSALGVKIALDDFGTGFSSLSLLRTFPVDVVKIDRSFVEPVLEDRSAYAIVKAVLGMCADMGLSTVAEGIETEQQRDVLRDLGCSHGQGYLFGHAEPLATLQPVLRLPLPASPSGATVRPRALA